MQTIPVSTGRRVEVLDITDRISLGLKEGIVVLHVPHTTAGIILNENEENLREDLERFYGSLAKGDWGHNSIDDNAEAHLASTLLGSSVSIPVENGSLALGTWQRVLFVELDGPRDRKVLVKEVSS